MKALSFILNYPYWVNAFFLGIIISISTVNAQEERCQWVKYRAGNFSLDSLTIVPNTIRLQNAPNEELTLWHDISTNEVIFSQILSEQDSVLVCYQVFPFNIRQSYYKRDIKQFYDANYYFSEEYLDQLPIFEAERNEIFALEGFQKSGNLSRGISFGNRQNIFVNSALNLQVEGNLSEDIRLRAIISDQNVPFQPEGNTQQIQEFDRVFVQLMHKKGTLTAGDIVLQNPDSYFLKYYKNVQGALLATDYTFLGAKTQTQIGVAVAKGKFASITLQAIEGVQGPYKITSPNQENFVIILANSEKVFLDGKQLQRGFNQDYTIDYNLGEITFTNRILITQFSRLRVDFEYAERNYARTLITASHYQTFAQGSFFVNFYQEADNPRNTLGIEISEKDKQALQEVGDATNIAFIDGVDSVAFQEGLILYQKIDTTINGIFYEDIFVYSNNPQKSFYQVRFTEVGFGKGDYVLLNSLANGLVFQWKPPLEGISQGNFAPVVVIPTPIQKQIINLGGSWNFDKKQGKIYIEGAFSTFDRNLFSNKDDEDNQGYAFKTGIKHQSFSLLKRVKTTLQIDYEQNNQYFNPIDRFRPIEFDRDWGLAFVSDTTQKNDKILTFIVRLEEKNENIYQEIKDDTLMTLLPQEAQIEKIVPLSIIQRESTANRLKYRITFREREVFINGWQQECEAYRRLGAVHLGFNGFILENVNDFNTISWQRFEVSASWHSTWLTLGYQFQYDKNQIRTIKTDSLQASLMNFESHQFFIQNNPTKNWQYRLTYTQRKDFAPVENSFREQLLSHTIELQTEKKWQQKHFLALQILYRNLLYAPRFKNDQQITDNLTGRLNLRNAFWQNNIRQELTLSTATGREPRREFIFLPVANGLGTHTWRDDNGDGLQSLDEFYLARNPDEQNFIKIFTTNNTFISAFTTNFLYRLQWNFPKTWKNKTKMLSILSRVSQVFSWNINRRIAEATLEQRLIPLLSTSEQGLLATQENLRSTIFYNRGSANFGIEVSFLQNRQKQLLTNGFEEVVLQEYSGSLRKNFGKFWNIKIDVMQQNNINRSDFLFNRNYQILSYKYQTQFSWQPSNSFRLSTGVAFSTKTNLDKSFEPENAQIQELNLEIRWNKLAKSNLNANMRYLNIGFQGEPNSPVGYQLLEALQVGENWVWNLNWQQSLSNGLQLTLVYEGRQSPLIPVVHIGRVQLSALF